MSDEPSNTYPLIPEEAQARAQQQHLADQERDEELALKNRDFVQLQKRAMKEFRRLIKLSPVAAELMFLLGEKMNRQNALMCSFITLSEITGLSRSTLSKAINLLKDEQWIQVIKIGTANAYLVNNSIFWQDTADKKYRHGQFAATIIASQSEQDISENWKNVTLRQFPFLESRNINAIKEITDEETGEIIEQEFFGRKKEIGEPVKRGRGRPRKNQEKPDLSDLQAKFNDAQPQHGPIPQTVIDIPDNPDPERKKAYPKQMQKTFEAELSKIKRGPGQPRKIQTGEENE